MSALKVTIISAGVYMIELSRNVSHFTAKLIVEQPIS